MIPKPNPKKDIEPKTYFGNCKICKESFFCGKRDLVCKECLESSKKKG